MGRGAEIAPLTPLRYDLRRLESSGGLGAVVAPPYDVISPEQRAVLSARHPDNIVQLELPEGEGDARYARAAEFFRAWRAAGVLVRDEEPAFYVYDQTFTRPGSIGTGAEGGVARKRRGFLGLVRLVPLSAGIVLPHERTHSGPREDRLKLFRAMRASVSPGFLLYSDPARRLDGDLERATTLTEFATDDGVRHRLAKLTDRDALRNIVRGVAESTLLIADGHHRYETALRYSEETTPAGRENAEHLYSMAFFANGDDPDLVVYPTHRHVHGLPSFDFGEFLEGARAVFEVYPLSSGASAEVLTDALARSGRRSASLLACAGDGRAVLLVLKKDVELGRHLLLGKKAEALRRTDVALLHLGLLEPVLGITPEMQSARTNILYPQDAVAALRDLRSGKGQVLFLMNATPVAQVREVAEAGEVMPQKSTFFYPKVLAGLAIHTLEPARNVAVV